MSAAPAPRGPTASAAGRPPRRPGPDAGARARTMRTFRRRVSAGMYLRPGTASASPCLAGAVERWQVEPVKRVLRGVVQRDPARHGLGRRLPLFRHPLQVAGEALLPQVRLGRGPAGGRKPSRQDPRSVRGQAQLWPPQTTCRPHRAKRSCASAACRWSAVSACWASWYCRSSCAIASADDAYGPRRDRVVDSP